MACKDLIQNTKCTRMIHAVAAAATTASAAPLDLLGYDSALILIDIGVDAAADADDYWTITLTESDDDSTYTNVAAADMIVTGGGALAAAGFGAIVNGTASAGVSLADDILIQIAYIGDKRYLEVTFTGTSTTADLATPISVIGIAGHPIAGPAS